MTTEELKTKIKNFQDSVLQQVRHFEIESSLSVNEIKILREETKTGCGIVEAKEIKISVRA